ncbi:hypothetical protein SAMN03159293_03482 [Pseudomonas sp. NFACC39-1]|nr:hypothetical protein SAMN03159293_03482 [Pseudomonas sp. NFACC39-1]
MDLESIYDKLVKLINEIDDLEAVDVKAQQLKPGLYPRPS